jgi:hypothetical protein
MAKRAAPQSANELMVRRSVLFAALGTVAAASVAIAQALVS